MKLYQYLIHAVYFSIFFVIFYIETIEIGGVKFALIWKAPLILLIFLKLLISKKIFSLSKYLIYGYLFNIKRLFTLSTFNSFFDSLSLVSKSIVFPLFINFFRSFYSKEKSLHLIKVISIYVTISTIPFLLGIIEPLKQGYDLSQFGLTTFGFIGVFQNGHSASMVLAFSVGSLIFFIKNENIKKIKVLYFVLISVGLYALIQTYVRTGLAMLLIGVVLIYFWRKNILYYLKLTPIIVLIFIGAFVYYQSNEALQMRFEERNVYQENNEVGFDNIGSGRFRIAYFAITNWWDEGVLSRLIGLGEELARKKMSETKGTGVFAHNGFIEILQTNGILGIFFYLNFIFYMFKSINTKINKNSKYFTLVLSFFLMYLVGMFFQGGDNFLIYVFMALALSLLKNKKKLLTIK